MALAVQGLTSDSVEEKVDLVETLVKASGGTGWMHESFDVQNPKRFTRKWFCWADSLFGTYMLPYQFVCIVTVTASCPLLCLRSPLAHTHYGYLSYGIDCSGTRHEFDR
jgi:hypothetical protein